MTDVEELTTEAFRNYMGHFASGVTVITAVEDGTPVGTTASAFSSLSLEPPMLLVCLNRTSHTGDVIHRTGRFAVNILGEEGPDIAMRFARKGEAKFDGVGWRPGPEGMPMLTDALASIECSVTEETQGGTHSVFIADARAGILRDGNPLAYYRGKFGRIETEADIHAARLIQEYIVGRDVPKDTVLAVDDLAAELSVPRNVIYHALGTLRDQGVVYRDDDGGFRVATLSLRMVAEAIEARRTIELGVVTSAAGKVPPEQMAALRAAAQRTLPDSDAARSESAWAEANRDFHDRVIDLAENSSLANVYRQFNITAIVGRIQHDAGERDRRELNAGDEHMRLVDALATGDQDAAAAAVTEHAEHSLSDIRVLLQSEGAMGWQA
ncbi:flavin reductase [Microbacterium sp.]|uniref:flavin reductase n=1 Tax=Microbacterium sp. TaxID=51671 RepID=UPI003A8B47ED